MDVGNAVYSVCCLLVVTSAPTWHPALTSEAPPYQETPNRGEGCPRFSGYCAAHGTNVTLRCSPHVRGSYLWDVGLVARLLGMQAGPCTGHDQQPLVRMVL